MDLDQVKQIIRDTDLSWNPMNAPDWHIALWKATLIYELDKAAKPKPLGE